MAFKDVFNFKQVVLKEMEAMGYDRAYTNGNPRPEQSGALDSDFSDWTKHYMYRYYKDFFLNTNDLGTVVLNKSDIITFFNSNLNIISHITNGKINFDTWTSDDFLPYLELVSFPILNEDKTVQYSGITVTNEKPASDYVLCYHDLQSPWPLVQKGEDEHYSVDVYGRYGRGNNGFRGGGPGLGSMNVATLCQSRINLQNIDADDKWLSLKTTMEAYDLEEWITLTPVNPDNDWRGSFIQNGQWLFKGKTANREKDTLREYYFYRKYEYTNDDGVVLGYRYIPLTPFLSQQYAGTTATSSNVRPWGGGFYSETQYPCFGFQPFNHNIIFDIGNNPDYTYDYMFSLPGLTYTQSESMNILAVNVDSHSLQHGFTQLFMRYFEIWQYLYLCEIKFETDETRAATIPYSELLEGFPPTIDSGGGGEGETAGPGGTTSGGNKEEISGIGGTVVDGSVIRKYPIPTGNGILPPDFYGGTYIPTYRKVIEITDEKSTNEKAVEQMNTIIQNLTRVGKANAIVECFISYSGFINYKGNDELTGQPYDYRYFLPCIGVDVNRPTYMCGYNTNDPNAYVPKNNKLLTFPFMSLEINGYGQSNELKFENLSSKTPKILMCSKFLPGAGILAFPNNYDGIKNNYDAGVVGQPLPIMPYTKNDYMNEYNANVNSRTATLNAMEQNRNLGYISSGISALSAIGGLATGLGLGAGMDSAAMSAGGGLSGLSGLASAGLAAYQSNVQYHQGLKAMEATLKDTQNRPLSIANQNSSPSIPVLNSNSAAPYVVWKSIRKSFAIKIDNFFTRYGYRVNKEAVPDIRTRPSFNFLRCTDAHIKGNIPNADLVEMKGILEKGITFWHTSQVGNYNQTNDAPIKNKPVFLNPSYQE